MLQSKKNDQHAYRIRNTLKNNILSLISLDLKPRAKLSNIQQCCLCMCKRTQQLPTITACVCCTGLQLRREALGFSVLRFWLFFRSGFRFLLQKTSVFRFYWSLRFADFSFFSCWFSVFVNNTSVSFGTRCGFWFFLFCPILGSGFCSI